MSELVPVQQRVATLRQLFDRAKPQIAAALPRHITADHMLRLAMTAVQLNPRLLDCTPTSGLASVMRAAQLGLELDGLPGRAYLIPRRNNRKGTLEANFQPGYLGLMDLARRSKEIANFDAREVYEGDKFAYGFGLKPFLTHIPCGETDEAKITHVYAIGFLLNGRAPFEVMSRAQVEAHRHRYSKDAREDSAWTTAWPPMAKKTVIIRVCKLLPASVELAQAVALQEHSDAGIPQDPPVPLLDADLTPIVPESEAKAPLDALADRIQGMTAAQPERSGDETQQPIQRPGEISGERSPTQSQPESGSSRTWNALADAPRQETP